MRTRHSPRNQETLWRALGDEKPEPVKLTTLERIASLERMLAAPGLILNKRTRAMMFRELASLRIKRARALAVQS